jgi:predicted N-acetyltransferase YhbS
VEAYYAPLVIRCLRPDEIDAVDALYRESYRRETSFVDRVRRYSAIEPTGWFVLEIDGALAGAVGVMIHGQAAWLGLMAIHPSRQGQGLGRALLDHSLAYARERGAPLMMLDASEAGFPLYRRSGFVERGKTLDAVRERESSAAPHLGPVDVEELVAFDREHFGADRSRTLRALLAEHEGRVVTARARGRLIAYAVGQSAIIGPVAAEDDAAAREVIHAASALPFDAPPRLYAPEERGPLVESLGFRVTRTLRHMRHGAPDISYRIVAKASMAIG